MIEKLGHYKIISELGRGGMGVVYKAYEESLNRYVAIKVLGEHLGHDDNFVKRFVREAKAAAGLSHSNVIQIYFIGNDQGRNYFVMEFVEGRSVYDVLKEGAIEPLRAARIVRQAASGLASAHDQGLVHRDIKPANLLITREEWVKIADFGLVLSPTDGATRLTATNSLMGTPGYLSPEQCCGEPAGPKSDIYSLGMTFYEMLSGSMPWKGESPLAVLRQILDEEPPSLLQIDPDLDPRIARVVERMVAKEPNDRYQSCHEVVAELDEILGARAPAPASAARSAAAVVPPVPVTAAATLAASQAKGTGGPQVGPTQVVSPTLPGTVASVAVAQTRPAAAAVPPPPPPAPVAAAAPPAAAAPAAVPPMVAANATAKSGTGGRWILIGVMAVMLVVAVSAAGLYFAAPRIKDAPFLRDVPFFKDADVLEQAASESAVSSEATTSSRVASIPTTNRGASPASNDGADDASTGTFETAARSAEVAAVDEPAAPSEASNERGGVPPADSASKAAAGVSPASRGVSSAPASADLVRGVAPAPVAPAEPSGERAAGASQITERPSAPAAPPPRRPAVRANPRVAVIGTGEATFASAAEEALESQLARHGVELYDERGILELRDSGGASRVAPSDLLHLVAGRGVDVMVLIDVEPLRERDLGSSGRYAYATTSRVRVSAYLAADGDAVGRGWSEQVEYADLNAASKADASMGGFSTEIADVIDAAWRDVRSGAR